MSRTAPTTYYRATAGDHPPASTLRGRHDVRVVIVGAGLAGLNTAVSLVERGCNDVMVLERHEVGFGASGRNGGFVFSGYSLGEAALLQQLGEARARRVFQRSVDAVEKVRARIHDNAIECDAVEQGVIWANWFRDPSILRDRQKLLADHFDAHWDWLSAEQMDERIHSDRYSEGLFESHAFHMHPLKYIRALAKLVQDNGAAVHERSPVEHLQHDGAHWCVRTAEGEVHAQHVVLACGGYLAGLRREVDRAVLPIATYVTVTEPLGERLDACLSTQAAVYDTRFAFDYYRPLADTRLLWGGRISTRNRDPAHVERLLRRDLHKVFPQLDGVGMDYAWSGWMSYARHQMPQVGGNGDGLWWAQAFGGHGLAPTTSAGELLAAAIADRDEDWRDLSGFGLSRSFRAAGAIAAQATYWWLQARDRLRESIEG